MKHIKNTFCYIISICLLIASELTACSNPAKQIQKYGFYFDTIISITLYQTDNDALIDQCFELASEYEKLLSNTKEESDISRINNNPNTFVDVDIRTIEVLKKAISYSQESHGLFDITIGKIVDLWDISTLSKLDNNENLDLNYLPSENEIKHLLPFINANSIEIQNNSVMLKNKDSKIDLGGIAKGYIADKMKEYLLEQGITSGVISLGGNVLTIGEKPDKSAFKIGIQKPFGGKNEVITTIDVKDKSVVTSGIYERYFKIDNQIYHHILDPRTGYPVKNDLYEVTIISEKSIDGDALSTTCFLLGLEDGIKYIESLTDTEAIFVTNKLEIIKTSGL